MEKENTGGSIHVGVLRIFCRFPAEPPHNRMHPCKHECARGCQVSNGRWPPGMAQAQAAAGAPKVSSRLAGPDLVHIVQQQQKESTPE